MTTEEVVNSVKTRKEAEELVVKLLQKFTTDAAYDKVYVEARDIKQAPREVWKRRVTNLFRSLETRRG